ncbi:MAG: hypothetical protein IIA60_09380, partial [Candidatus Marinimicrobia bacterium]|nr:hypothetical protein [Candidatus Neomarinimicrobiota bacterium]
MNLYRYSVNLKAGLFALGIIIVVSLLWYTQTLVAELQTNERKLLDFYAQLIGKVATEAQSEDLGFVFDQVIQQIQFPIVVTSDDGRAVSWRNVQVDSSLTDAAQQVYLARLIKRMDRNHQPVDVRYGDRVISRIHYGDSSIVSQLQWLPFVEIVVAALFILVGFAGFSLIRNSEKSSIWVGMAREMAHQLGTPVSALMGWTQLLRDRGSTDDETLDELEQDVHRLEQIADRFHKIGSLPHFELWDLHLLAESSAAYFRQRLPKAADTTITVTGSSTQVRGAETLVQWALENLIKNALEAHDADILEDGRVGNNYQALVTFDGDLRSFAYAMEHAAPKAKVSLLSSVEAVAPGKAFDLGIYFQLEPGWNIYWQNPGDSGLAPRVTWTLPDGFSVGELRYPIPKRHHSPGDIVTNILSGDPMLIAQVTPPADLKGDSLRLRANVTYLVCSDKCIREQAIVSIDVSVLARGAETVEANARLLGRARRAQPQSTSKSLTVTPRLSPPTLRSGSKFTFELDVKIKRGMHIQSNTPTLDSLIPADVFLYRTPGVFFEKAVYP